MAAALLPAVSDGLLELKQMFAPFRDLSDDEVATLDAPNIRRLIAKLNTLHHLAKLDEQELGALRLLERGKGISNAAETAAVSAIQDLSRNFEANVVRPDFGGKRP